MPAFKTNVPLLRRVRGFSLIEVVFFILIVSLLIGGMVPIFSMAATISADPLTSKQALAFAQGMLEEIQAQRTSTAAINSTPRSGARTAFTSVGDYNLYFGPVSEIDGTPVTVTGKYLYSLITITSGSSISLGLPDIIVGPNVTNNMTSIQVTVTGPDGNSYTVAGYASGPG